MNGVCNKPDATGFVAQQLAFAARVRDPHNSPLPTGVEARRMAVYEELIYNNIDEFLHSAFPVLHAISTEHYWHALVRGFLTQHRARTPLFPELPREFLDYLEHNHRPRDDDHPFLLELAHYEWAELALSISEVEIDEARVNRDGSLLEEVPVLSPLVLLGHYRYPVHRIGPDYLPREADDTPTHLLVYRDRADQVGFLELNPASAQLLHELQQGQWKNGLAMLQSMAAALHHPNPDTVIEGGLQLLRELQARDVILGTRKTGR